MEVLSNVIVGYTVLAIRVPEFALKGEKKPFALSSSWTDDWACAQVDVESFSLVKWRDCARALLLQACKPYQAIRTRSAGRSADAYECSVHIRRLFRLVLDDIGVSPQTVRFI